MKSLLYITIVTLAFSAAGGNPKNIIKFECEYDPNLIEKKQKNISFNNKKKLDSREICKKFKCKDVVEVNVDETIADNKNKYRLRNSWFNHQGILIDDFTMTKNIVTINTFVSQAYYLESYMIDRSTGKTKRTFYKFDYYELLEDINKIESDTKKKISLYNENGKISLKTLTLFNLKPQKKIIFEGKCMEGIGV